MICSELSTPQTIMSAASVLSGEKKNEHTHAAHSAHVHVNLSALNCSVEVTFLSLFQSFFFYFRCPLLRSFERTKCQKYASRHVQRTRTKYAFETSSADF